MKIIECANRQTPSKRPAGLELMPILGRLTGQSKFDGDQAVIAALQRVLDNRYILLRNINLPGLDVPIPIVLIGPTGVRVIYPSTAEGIFRSDGEQWEQLDGRGKNYRPASPNLTNRTHLMGQVVQTYLNRSQINAEVEPVLFFVHPGVHVDAPRPVVRIVLMDALDHFAMGLSSSPLSLGAEGINAVVAALAPGQEEGPAADPQQEFRAETATDVFSLREPAVHKANLSAAQVIMEHHEPAILKKMPFSRRQWVVLGTLLMANIVILLALIMVVMTAT